MPYNATLIEKCLKRLAENAQKIYTFTSRFVWHVIPPQQGKTTSIRIYGHSQEKPELNADTDGSANSFKHKASEKPRISTYRFLRITIPTICLTFDIFVKYEEKKDKMEALGTAAVNRQVLRDKSN